MIQILKRLKILGAPFATERNPFAQGVLAAILAIIFAAPGMAAESGECAKPARVVEVAPGAFVRPGITALPNKENRGAIANIGFIIGSESVAVIDSGASLCDGQQLRAAIAQRTSLPVSLVINSHVHPDHVLGNAAFAGDGTKFIAHDRMSRAFAERGQHYLASYGEQIGPEAMQGTQIMPPDIGVADEMRFDLGGREIIVRAHPAAHTDHDLTVLDKAYDILWTGDLIFMEHIPVLDGSLKGWIAVTMDLMSEKVKYIVPGHGPVKAPWPQSGEKQLGYLNRLADDLRKDIAAGKTINEAAASAGMAQSGDWLLFDEFNQRNAVTGFAELEWE